MMHRTPASVFLAVLINMTTGCSAVEPAVGLTGPVSVAAPIDETGQTNNASNLTVLRKALRDGLGGYVLGPVLTKEEKPRHGAQVIPRVIHCTGSSLLGTPAPQANDGGCLGTVSLHARGSDHVLVDVIARTSAGTTFRDLGIEMASAIRRALSRADTSGERVGMPIGPADLAVSYLGDSIFSVRDHRIDLGAIRHAHDPVVDPDVPAATNVTMAGVAEGTEATITLYQVDPPLTGLPSREQGIDRGTDFRDPASLVKAAYTNYVSPVLTDDPVPVRVAGHPIGHFFVKVAIPGFPIILTGMTTIMRADTELVDLTLGRELGIGGVLLTPQPGRLNTSSEVVRELALRQRRLRVVDGLHFRSSFGGNLGPEYLFDDGRVVFARIRLPIANATDALAFFIDYIRRGEHNRFGSLTNGPFKGTGAGCAAFAIAWLQAAGVVPFITQAPPMSVPESIEALGPDEFWRAIRAKAHIPWRHLGCDERVGAASVMPAELTVYDLLFHNETPASVRAASEGLAARIRASYGVLPATLFQLGVLTPLPDLLINARRRDADDRGDYTWVGAGVEFAYWDNSRFAAWIKRVWEAPTSNPRIRPVREGHFKGVEVDAMKVARQMEPFFSAADRRDALLAMHLPPAASCQEVFARGLE